MTPKLPLRLKLEMPFAVDEWLIWFSPAATMQHALQIANEIKLRMNTHLGKELVNGAFRFSDARTMKTYVCRYVLATEYNNPDIWQYEDEE